MRIIAGEFKGQRLTVPRDKVRPTSERLRESLFNALGEELVMNSLWLDAFAGSGAVGIEALSRGAQHVLFNDRDRFAHEVIRSNLERCGVSTGFTVLQKDVFVLLRDPPASFASRPLGVLFLDPPYDFGRYRKLLLKAIDSRLVDHRTLLVLEIFKKTKLEFIPEELYVSRTLKGGDSHLLFLSQE